MRSSFVRLGIPEGVSSEARDALALLVIRAASPFSFQGLEDWSVDLPPSARVLGAEREFLDLRGKGPLSRELRVYFALKADGTAFARLMTAAFSDLKVYPPKVVGKRDWMREWRKSYKTQQLSAGGRSLSVVPAWLKAPKGAVAVKIHPGQAFGTGTHPTTRLCIQAFLNAFPRLPESPRVLDFGAGTGLLALAALVLAKEEKRSLTAVAVESDPDALKQCEKNAKLNRQKIRLLRKLPRGRFDFIFANVLAPVLLDFQEELADRLNPGGLLVLSGILEKERRAFVRDFQQPSLRLRRSRKEQGWAALEFQKVT
jgi:ribosomal protein L11 methyltransferase